MKSRAYHIQFITHHNANISYIESARISLQGGCRWIQLRMKDAEESLFEESAIVIQRMCREYGATFIINDNVHLAQRIGADGVHLGKGDMPISEARIILGERAIIGATVNSFEDIVAHTPGMMPDYFGCGPFRYTTTKQRLAPILGFEGYRTIIHKMRDANITTPLVAIGGVTKEDITPLLECGVDGIALSGTILRANNPILEMSEIVDLFEHRDKSNLHNLL